MAAEYYDGPALTGEAITVNRFCGLNTGATPDTIVMLDVGTTIIRAYVSTVALSSGQSPAGLQSNGIAIVDLLGGQNPAANVRLTASTDGQATAATTGDFVYGITTEPASAAGGYVPVEIMQSPIVMP